MDRVVERGVADEVEGEVLLDRVGLDEGLANRSVGVPVVDRDVVVGRVVVGDSDVAGVEAPRVRDVVVDRVVVVDSGVVGVEAPRVRDVVVDRALLRDRSLREPCVAVLPGTPGAARRRRVSR